MATLQLTPSTLSVRLTRREKIAGLLRDVTVPLSAVREVDVVPDALAAARGLRAPGLGLPGLRKIGTWRRPGTRMLVCVRRGQPAVRIRLAGQDYDTLLVGADDAAAVAASLPAGR
ncbi:hypothetical protein [Blastococcus sp. SYSU DS0619]